MPGNVKNYSTNRARVWRTSALVRVSLGLHAGGVAALALAPRAWPLVVGTLVADHLAVVSAGLWPRGTLLGPTLVRLLPAARARREIALTFDDGPDPATTLRVLDLLDARGARSTFFCIGRRVEAHPDLAAEIARRGHLVENHSHRHRNGFWFLPPAMLRDEIERAQEAIATATGRAPRLFRAPAGIRSPLLEPALARAGLDLAAWTRRGFDTVTGDAGRVLARLVRGLAPGDILLLHDGSSARATSGGPVILEVLPRLLDAVEAAGLNPVPLEPSTAGARVDQE
jgi:peptidoglycan/xylan/chitin deacetylase (PgdA/CDA1 family)